MNFKNFSIILALLSFELKVFSTPLNDVTSELSASEISDIEELNDVDAVELNEIEEELEATEIPTEILTEIPTDFDDEATEVPTDSMTEITDLPCDDIQTCIGWMRDNKEVLVANGYDVPDEIFDYLLIQGIDEKNVEILQQNFEAVSYGTKVDVNGHEMSVNIKGEENNTTIVVLPGLGVISPVIYYKSLTEILANDYKVVTIEPFGYGVSDIVDEERNAENIVDEVHTCLQELGIDQYYLMGHSIGGIYSLIYDNTYEDEVLGFIGLDNTPNHLDKTEEDVASPNGIYTFSKILNKYHLWALLPESLKEILMGIAQEKQYQNYSEEDLAALVSINDYRYENLNIVDESKHVSDNVASSKDMYFHCPILMFISEETQKILPEWIELHEEMINNNPEKELMNKSKIISLEETTHAFIHTQKKEVIAEEIKQWII